MIAFLWMTLWLNQGPLLMDRLNEATQETAFAIMEALIEGEDLGELASARQSLVNFLIVHPALDQRDIRLVARALAHLDEESVPEAVDLAPSEGRGQMGAYRFFFMDGQWFGCGDRLGSYFVLDIEAQTLTLEAQDGRLQTLSLPPWNSEGNGLFCPGIAVLPALRFCARRANLNLWAPIAIKATDRLIHGSSWIELVDELCRANGLAWTKHQQSIVLRDKVTSNKAGLTVSGHRDLGSFLQFIARALDLELIMDDTISHIQIDVEADSTDWQEALDCVAIMNGLEWTITRDNEKPRLIVTQR